MNTSVETTNRKLTTEQVIAIRKMRGDHFAPHMSYAKIQVALDLPVNEIATQYAGWGITYSDIQGPKGWAPHPAYQNRNSVKKAEARRARREAAALKAAEKKAAKEVKISAKKAPALKNEKGQLTEAGIAKVLALAAKGESQKNIATDLGVNASTVSRAIAKAKVAK